MERSKFRVFENLGIRFARTLFDENFVFAGDHNDRTKFNRYSNRHKNVNTKSLPLKWNKFTFSVSFIRSSRLVVESGGLGR